MVTFPKVFSAIGQHFTSYLHSLFLFFFGTVRKNLGFIAGLRGGLETDQQQPARLPSSSPSSTSSDIATEEDDNANVTNTNTPPLSSADQYIRNSNDDDDDDDDKEMAAGASSAPKKAPLPKIIPALPLIPIVSRRGSSAGKATKQDVQHLGDGIKRLELNGRAPNEQQQDSTAAPSEAIANNNTQNGLEKENKDVNGKGKEPIHDPFTVQPLQDANLNGVVAKKEVVRSPPVPIIHEVSQNSNLKETVPKLETATILVPEVVETPEQAAERAIHSGFMRDALDMARLALRTNETPVGCVLVYRGRVIAKGMNATNVSRNGTRHAELMAISALLSYSPASDLEDKKKGSSAKGKGKGPSTPFGDRTNTAKQTTDVSVWGDVDPTDGHLFPYGQKLHPSPRVDRSVITECTLYVTVEPCIMCASLLRQLGIKKVYFGAVNDKFGGTGGVFRIHKNSPQVVASAPPSPAPQNGKGLARPMLERRPVSTSALGEPQASSGDEKPETPVEPPIDPATLPGDGGNIERGYEVEGGWGRDEAVTLLRQFYVQENGRAPVPRKKEGRAARLAAMMERDGHAGGPMIDATAVPGNPSSENGEANTNEQKEGEQPTESPAESAPCEAAGEQDKVAAVAAEV